jgi:4-amino-4-deoxy-L-arabinose transferase-like glycosyltransferase
MPGRRDYIVISLLALTWGTLLATAIHQPGYTDAYYYFNAGQRLVEGKGLTDPYLWTYVNAPDHLPGPSHTYWMPLESLAAAASMAVLGASFTAAQVPSVVCFAGLVIVAFWLGAQLGRSRRHAWLAGLLVLFSGFFTPFWTTTDTFALYGLVGSLSLAAMGRGRETGDWRWYAVSGGLGGLAHLARADGVLLVLVLLCVALWPQGRVGWRRAGHAAAAGVIAYLLVMLPWFIRNMSVLGTPLPTGGTDTIWMRSYDELVNYPPGATPAEFWGWGLGNILQSRFEALTNNVGTFIAVETWVVLGPFVLAGLWIRRREPFMLGVILYAAGLHLVMTFVFAFPGYRGGLFHSSAALLPFWAAIGPVGLDAGIGWMARRRHWRKVEAQAVFGGALVVLAALISVTMCRQRMPALNSNADFYSTLAADLPDGAVVMVNDPAALYYHTGLSGVVVPNAYPEVVPEIAARYGVTYLVLDRNRTQPFTALYLGREERPFLRLDRVYGAQTADSPDGMRVFEIVPQEHSQ